jgi:dolichol-phosphate mannosyltransferase/undecaprenyl-phosphate 4-deoxy-4-formamido-L-arabinose transferase
MEDLLYSIVIPVFNSETTLKEICSRIKNVFKILNENYEIILVDDGSSDNSWKMM